VRTWDRLSATFVRGLKQPGKFYDGGGLMLQATATKAKGVVTKAWLFRYQIDHAERCMVGSSSTTVPPAVRKKTFRRFRSMSA
jgi:hypothetical protein